MPVDDEKLWGYVSLVRLWSWSLIGVAGGLLVVSALMQASSSDGLTWQWLVVAVGVSALTGALGYPLLRGWLARSAPSRYLERATPMKEPRRLEASPAYWRRWAITTIVVLLGLGAAMLVFLVGVLRNSGPDGIAEGVVVGLLIAWGLATLHDAGRIERAEIDEGRRYYAACRRPTGVGNRLVWVAREVASP